MNYKRFIRTFLLFPDKLLAKAASWLIKIYQKTISPDHSQLGESCKISGCKFYPSCSHYALIVLKQTGFILGIWKIFWRILRCHPFSNGGVDFPRKVEFFEKTSKN
ncbi:membrane protein insertion efficiency factor YidD [Candidatus Gracilibacteria bacterium]|nr:membrane protein insertion efficiency factor YidD [Candidatus Gracilibacteria bacterium]